jgi:two-component system copper resistance phosphate regulon response regulator CusR
MKILIVEDEITTLTFLQKGLNENGYAVDVTQNGREGLFLAKEIHYDLLILDVMLPELDGFSFLAQFRRTHQHTPVLYLTARDNVTDRVKGLQLGADDYVIKPFAFSELLARIQSLLRRSSNSQSHQNNVLSLADLRIDLSTMKVSRAGKNIELSAKEFVLLCYLAKNNGQVLSRAMISEHVWDINFDTQTNVVEVAIRRLREKIDRPFENPLIHTRRGLGYVFEETIS